MTRIPLFLFTIGLVFSSCASDAAPTSRGAGNEAAPGPANAIDAEISGSDGSTTSLSGSAEVVTPETNQAVVALGSLTVFLSSNDGVLTNFSIAAPAGVIPGTVSITSGGDSGTWLTIASIDGVYTSAGGSISVNQCPEAGGVVTGTFEVSLNDLLGATSTLTGTWRATVATSDGSITCRKVEPEPGDEPAPGDDTGTAPVCELEDCDGPCCPYIDQVAQCGLDCSTGPCNPLSPGFDMTGVKCSECFTDCEDIYLEAPQCAAPYQALVACEANSGCDAFDEFEEEDRYDACIAAECCAEAQAAF